MWEFLSNAVHQWWGILILSLVCLVIFLALATLFYRSFFKRFFDCVLSFFAIIVISPLLTCLIILGAIKMKGNPFFIQKRPGKKGKIFKLIKFRTMSNEKDEKGNYLPDEKRLNGYGKFLRDTSLDELPELFNIFLGTMSIVGPRPQLVRDMVFMSEDVKRRHLVRSGLTGLAQVMGRNNVTWEEKFDYDLQYVENVSLINDLKIIFLTVVKVLKRSDVSRDGMATDIDYGDWLLKNGAVTKEEYDERQLQAKELLKD